MAYAPSQIYAALVAQGIPAQDAATLTQISGAESGFGAKTVSNVNANGSIDYGVFQVNNAAWPQFGGPAIASAPLDQQAAAAAQIYKAQGLTAWSTFTSGKYQAFPSGASAGGQVIAAGPSDSSSGLNAGSSASGLSSALGSAATDAATTAANAALISMGLPPIAGAVTGGGGDTVNVGLSPQGQSTIGGWISNIEKSTGDAFNSAVDHALAATGINLSALQNWFVRAGVILLGLVIIVVGLVGLLWDHGGKEIAGKVGGAVAMAA